MTAELPDVANPTSPPREGLPPCVKLSRLDNRYASLRNSSLCDGHHKGQLRFWVMGGDVGAPATRDEAHPDLSWSWHVGVYCGVFLETDDPAEAEAAYGRAQRYVLTGEL